MNIFLNEQLKKFRKEKGNTQEELAEYLGIPLSQVAAFGDDRNDMEMVQKCGLGVAMANASDEVKQNADFITLSNEDDGLAYVIEKFIL